MLPIAFYPTSGMSSFLLKTDHRTCISELITKLNDFAHGWQWLLHEKCWIKRLSLEYDVEKVINVKHVQSFPSFPGTWSIQSTKKEKKLQESLQETLNWVRFNYFSYSIFQPAGNLWTKSCTPSNVYLYVSNMINSPIHLTAAHDLAF